MKFKIYLLKVYILLNQIGIDPIKFLNSFRAIPKFFYDFYSFKRFYKGKFKLSPNLHDRYEESGISKSEYFWQDLLVAKWIYASSPEKHVDVGSRIDGFVTHVASFREIEVFDIRPISSDIPGVIFRQADLMNANSMSKFFLNKGYCDSLSCLHTIEHFGLGRYGDPINVNGYHIGLENMAKLIRPKGIFYLSTPIGEERVEFNANWVFDPRNIIQLASDNGLKLDSLTIFSNIEGVIDVDPNEINLKDLANQSYNLGIFKFIKS